MSYVANLVRYEGDPKVVRSGPSSVSAPDKLAKALGWLSLGLGVAELIAPGRITRMLGMRGSEAVVRTYGAREVASGVLSLSTEKQAGLWSRVAGDGLDATTLLTGLRDDNPKRANVSAALVAVLGVMVLDLAAARLTAARHRQSTGRRRLYQDRSGYPMGAEAAAGAATDLDGAVLG